MRLPTTVIGTKKHGLPIDEVMTRGVSVAIEQAGASPEIVAAGQAYLNKRLIAETDLILSGVRSI